MTIDNENGCKKLNSFTVNDIYTNTGLEFTGTTILCTGGLNGFFEGMTTGTVQNTGNAAAMAFFAGVEFANLEFIQYHPTTVSISGKRMLVSEAARGEGGRLFVMKNNSRYYFMEEKYPKLGNLMPRDVISREMALLHKDGLGPFFLDMTGIDGKTWNTRLSDLRDEVISYLGTNPAKEPVAVSPGIHYFMGGIRVDDNHRTNVEELYAAGEAACKYHGANRLGGNSMLGAFYGGRTAALDICKNPKVNASVREIVVDPEESFPALRRKACALLFDALGIIRSEASLKKAIADLDSIKTGKIGKTDSMRLEFGKAMLLSALERKESRGAHYREDYPKTKDNYRKQTCVTYSDGTISISFKEPVHSFEDNPEKEDVL